jgi:transcriptional regulator with XRE-family HTH domain
MSLGSSLKNAREEIGLTQEEVAKKLYVTRQTVSRWEQNKTLPNINVLVELSRIYQISLDELILETRQPIEEEKTTMKKMNYFALFGAIAFNVLLFSGVFLSAIVLLFALWLVVGLFLLSPVLLLIFNITGLQDFSIIQSLISILLCVLGSVLYPFAKKATHELIEFFNKYTAFNKKIIYQEHR